MMEHFIEERQRDTFIPALSLVAVLEDDTIVGEVALHETDIVTENGNITQLVLSQSAVLPEYRMQGIMRMLVEYALKEAEKMENAFKYKLQQIQNQMMSYLQHGNSYQVTS